MNEYKQYIIYFYAMQRELNEYKSYRDYRMASRSHRLTVEEFEAYLGKHQTSVEYWNAGCTE